ncbi:Uncharacterized protein Fot_24735 [Forsythia ovata]|uniref:Uncharacterized protein n=1 Tax=Forsythia ovata TaxID=205694 RepID=A0ABD1U733_9LAMI
MDNYCVERTKKPKGTKKFTAQISLRTEDDFGWVLWISKRGLLECGCRIWIFVVSHWHFVRLKLDMLTNFINKLKQLDKLKIELLDIFKFEPHEKGNDRVGAVKDIP